MDLLFVMDPIEGIHPYHDTTFALMLEAQRREYGVWYARLDDLSWEAGRARARAWRVTLRRTVGDHATLGVREERDLERFAIVFMRKDPPVDAAYLHATAILEGAPRATLVVNRPETLRACNEKLYTTQFPALMPPTIISRDLGELRAFVERQGGEGVVKPIEGRGGEGVFYLSLADRNHKVILEAMTDFGRRYVMAQRYLPEILETGDKRLIVVRGEPLGAVVRLPKGGDFRSNVHVGGRATPGQVDERDREICRTVGPDLVRRGILFAGLDVIAGRLTEINITSPTLVQEIAEFGGPHLERAILDAAEEERRRAQA
jgi:glutathione synthase